MEQTETTPSDTTQYLSFKELCGELHITAATGRNWLKLGRLAAACADEKELYFDRTSVLKLKKEIQSGENAALKSRRNKHFVSGHSLYECYAAEGSLNAAGVAKLLRCLKAESIEPTTEVIRLLVAECALQFFADRLLPSAAKDKPLLEQYLRNDFAIETYGTLIDDLIADKENALAFCRKHPELFAVTYIYNSEEDILGLLYLSCRNLAGRKACGAYYTPADVVRRLLFKCDFTNSDRILDPCCGTGSFLLHLPSICTFSQIYGNDMDELSVQITRINLALKYPDATLEELYSHITVSDYLMNTDRTNYDYIIGNPPWGYAFEEKQKEILRTRYQTAGKHLESYDLFVERALSMLAPSGSLCFVLPQAILHVQTHRAIREQMLLKTSITSIEVLGNVFDGVQCPCILLQLKRNSEPFSAIGTVITDGTRHFIIRTERFVSPDCLNLFMTDEEYALSEKIKHTSGIQYLKNHAVFALGIVTGNNAGCLLKEPSDGCEPVIKGTNVYQYHIEEPEHYLSFNPRQFQQCAPEKYYRAPEKLLYRFICSRLVFAYDDRQHLSLNSCNLVIPDIPGMPVKYVLAVLNSSVAQFLFEKDFHSVKVLRAHIERIPIPPADERTMSQIIHLTDELLNEMDTCTRRELYTSIDTIIFRLFDLTEEEQRLILQTTPLTERYLCP